MEWKPASIEAVKKIVHEDLANCDDEQVTVFRRYEVEPYLAQITRYGETGKVVVIARNGEEVMYWEDFEEGFNVSPIGTDGRILEHWCTQDELRFALNHWIKGRTGPLKLGPAKAIE
jgi:hypothetical protein